MIKSTKTTIIALCIGVMGSVFFATLDVNASYTSPYTSSTSVHQTGALKHTHRIELQKQIPTLVLLNMMTHLALGTKEDAQQVQSLVSYKDIEKSVRIEQKEMRKHRDKSIRISNKHSYRGR